MPAPYSGHTSTQSDQHSGVPVETTVSELPWDERLGGGWSADCPIHGDIWTNTTNDKDSLADLQARAERAALLHDDNDHATILTGADGEPTVR